MRYTGKFQSIAYLSVLSLGILLLLSSSSTTNKSTTLLSSPSYSTPTWQSILTANCKIAFHIHIPKTGGTSILEALKTFPNFHELPRSEQGDFYAANPLNTMKSLQTHVFDSSEYQDFISSKDHNNVRKSSIPQIITSAEKGIETLENIIHYPDFNNTCFFGTVRNPYEWVLSAENHMKTVSQYTGGISGDWGFFNRPNIQSSMMGYLQKKKGRREEKNVNDAFLHHQQDVEDDTFSNHHYRTCMFTIDLVPEVLTHLWETNRYHGTPPMLPDCNVKEHDRTITPELEQVIQDKYNVDLELWEEVTNSQNNGILCL